MKNLILGFLLIAQSAFSQSKMNFGAALALHNKAEQEKTIFLLVKGSVDELKKITRETGDEYIYSVGDISSVKVKAKNIELFASNPFIERIEARNPNSKLQPMHDSMLVHNRVLPVHQGMSPLAQAYKGKNVVVGFIDTGIDFTHPDFQDTAGKTRIKFIWDQSLSTSGPPPPYNYGRQYTSNAIDNNFANAHLATAALYGGHGTHVASEAAGNGFALNRYEGVAPEADIIFVALDFANPNGITDAADYIYNKAASLGQPCVINASIGDYYGSHDGTDLQAQAIQTLIQAQSGRGFVAAGGNCGNCILHTGYTVSSTDTNFTWFGNASNAYIAMYADTNDLKNVQFTIGADAPAPNYSFRGNLPFTSIASNVGVLKYDTIWNGSNRLCTIESYGDLAGGVYSMEYNIYPDSATYNWRLMTTGTGKIDVYTFDVITANLADTTIYFPLKKYKQPDYNSNIVSSFQCLDEVITVANYINRNQHVDYDTILQVNSSMTAGDLDPSSSHGPTRDGRIKPDIAAPGQYQLGAMVLSLFSSYAHANLGVGGMHRIGNGTSAASPTVAGIAALYLDMDSTADWQQVKDAITNCARIDSFTGTALPNNLWGHGKADAFNTLTNCVVSTEENQNFISEALTVYPNPFNSEATIAINIPDKSKNAELKIMDVMGKEIKSFRVNRSEKIIFKKGNLTGGIYCCVLQSGGEIISAQKMIISE